MVLKCIVLIIKGFWNTDSFTGAYQSRTLPFDVIRVLAGFESDVISYNLKRDLIDPPENLEKLIFPWIENGFEVINTMIENKVVTSEHSGLGFLRTMKFCEKFFCRTLLRFILRLNLPIILFISLNFLVVQSLYSSRKRLN